MTSSFLSRVADVDLSSYFLLFLPFFLFRFGQRLFFFLSFSCGCYAVSSVSVSAASRLAFSNDIYLYQVYICILIRTYARLTFFFLSEVYRLLQLLCVLSSFFICFPPEVILCSRVIGACPVTTDCIVTMSLCENTSMITYSYATQHMLYVQFRKFYWYVFVTTTNITACLHTWQNNF